jgi:hypothetical protein
MLRDEEIQMELGRASHGGDFLRLWHVPTGIMRYQPGPLRDVDQHALMASWLSEVEAELQAKGLTQYIIPVHRTSGGGPRKRPHSK